MKSLAVICLAAALAACASPTPMPDGDHGSLSVDETGTYALDVSEGAHVPVPLQQLQKTVLGAGNTSIDYNERWVKGALIIGSSYAAANKLTRILGATSTIDFASTTTGKVDSSAITVTGAKAGDPCFVGVPAAAGALKAQFSCYVSAADAAKVVFEPMDLNFGTQALTSASPSTGTASVSSGTTCSCAPIGTTAAIAAGGCASSVSSTTLTMTGPNTVTTTMVYSCSNAVDPASGAFFVWVVSSQ
jgi:hypothetical protein